jgi:hypothetical protein
MDVELNFILTRYFDIYKKRLGDTKTVVIEFRSPMWTSSSL